MVVGDALFCQRDLAAKVVGEGGDDLLAVKDNREALTVDIRAGFAFEDAARRLAAATSPCGHPVAAAAAGAGCHDGGRVEVRTLRTTSVLTAGSKWPGLRPGIEWRRERWVKGTVEVEVSYAITSLSPDEAGAERLRVFVRDHGAIKNQLHDVRDVTLGEDACRVRTGSAPQVLAALRNAAVHRLAGVPADRHPAALEHLQANPDRAEALLGVPQSR